jgi:hypothetical protein
MELRATGCDIMLEIVKRESIEPGPEGRHCFDLSPEGIPLPELLVASIERVGILHPLIVRPLHTGKYFQLIAGFKRYSIAKQLYIERIPVFVLPAKRRGDYASLIYAVEDNRSVRALSPMEICMALRLFACIHDSEKPKDPGGMARLLGIPPVESRIEDYLNLDRLDRAIQRKVHLKDIDFEQARILLKTDGVIARFLTAILLSGVHLNANRMKIAAEYLVEICRREGISPEGIIEAPALSAFLNRCKEGKRCRATEFQSILRTLRYPILSELQARFDRLSKGIASGIPVTIHHPEQFEGDCITVTIKARNRSELTENLKKLCEGEKERLFDGLFELLHDYEV